MGLGECNASGTTRYRPFVSEDEVGITEFSTPDLGGIGGRLKLLPADFIVEELAPELPPSPSGGPSDLGEGEQPGFVEFTLHKTRLGTLQATTALASELGVPPSTFTVAGLKDSHALTTQRVSCRRALLDEAAIREAADRLPRLAVEDFEFKHQPLKIGRTSGNRFRLVLRDIITDGRTTEAVVSAVRQRGFLNYYGLQRFGHTGTRNPAVGRAYLARQYKEMVEAILGFQAWGCASAKETAARNAWVCARNARLALQLMPASCSLERHVLEMLVRLESTDRVPQQDEEADCRRAVLSVPLQTRMLFAYAYFNALWNKMASERVRRFGLEAIEGDCVIADREIGFDDAKLFAQGNKNDSPDGGRATAASHGHGLDHNQMWTCTNDSTDTLAPIAADDSEGGGEIAIPLRAVRRVSAEEAKANVFSIYDVVLPLPGTDIEYPGHVVGELIEKFLQYDGLRDVHSFEKAVTIRDANNEIVEDDETPRFTPGRDIVDEIATGSGDDDSNRQDEGDDEDEDIEQDEDKENKDEEEDKTFGSGGLARWRWHDTNEYHLPGAYRRLMIRPGQWTHRQVEYTGYTQLLRPLEEIDKCALLAHNDRKDQSGVGMVRPDDRCRQERQRCRALGDGVRDADEQPRKRQRSQMLHIDGASTGDAETIDGSTSSREVPEDCDKTKASAISSAAVFALQDQLQVKRQGESESRRGLVCEFSLPPGTYATMLFRELQKDGRPPRQRLQQHVRFSDDDDE